MRIKLNTIKVEDIFPVMEVVDGVAVSIRGSFTMGWELTLPVAYTKNEDQYDEMMEAFVSALRVLEPWTVLHRQDVFIRRSYSSGRTGHGSYLESCYDKHFEGRSYLEHKAYLFLSFVKDGLLVNKESKASGLFGLTPTITPPPRSKFRDYLNKAREFMAVASTPGHFSARELTREDWLGDGNGDPGIVQRYMMLGEEGPMLSDIPMTPSTVQVHEKVAQAFVIGESKHMSKTIASVKKNDAMSSGPNAEVFLSLASSLGVLLDMEHVVNHYIVVPPQQETLQKLDSKRKNMNAGIMSRDNRVNNVEISGYLDDAERENYLTVLTHLNVIAWGTEREQASISARLSAALMQMGMDAAVKEQFETPVLYYAGIPSAEVDLGTDNLMTQEVHAALCLGIYETFDRGFGKGDLRLCDRVRNIPVVLDVDEVAVSKGLAFTYNKFVIGPSGTGKSFVMNRILNCEYNAGAEVFVIDVGGSYQVHTAVVNETSEGKDGHYISWDSADDLPAFNPFVGFTRWLDANGNLAVFVGMDDEEETGVDYIISVLQTIYTPDSGWTPSNEPILKQIVRDFVEDMLKEGKDEGNLPVFQDLYDYVSKVVGPKFRNGKFKVGDDIIDAEDFDVKKFHISMKPYSAKGEFSFFYNAKKPMDIFSSRWVVADLYTISKVKDQNFYSLVVLQLMHSFDIKMRSRGSRKILVVDEAWQAIMNRTMAPYLKGLWKTCRKYSTAAVVVTQEIEDIISSDVIKDAILANSDIKILLDQTRNRNLFLESESENNSKDIKKLLGLTREDVATLLSMNKKLNPAFNYREVFIKYAGGFSAVYANEPSPEEALAYESNYKKKEPLLAEVRKTGSYIKAIENLSQKHNGR